MKNTGKLMLVIGLPLVILSLFVWGRTLQSHAPLTMVEGTNVACLVNGHQQLALHIHPNLRVTVDGEQERIPANIGITNTCMAEIHTHDASGQIHVETVNQERFDSLTFADFFDVWGQPLERDGYNLQILFNGEEKASAADIPLEDGSVIDLIYTSDGATS